MLQAGDVFYERVALRWQVFQNVAERPAIRRESQEYLFTMILARRFLEHLKRAAISEKLQRQAGSSVWARSWKNPEKLWLLGAKDATRGSWHRY